MAEAKKKDTKKTEEKESEVKKSAKKAEAKADDVKKSAKKAETKADDAKKESAKKTAGAKKETTKKSEAKADDVKKSAKKAAAKEEEAAEAEVKEAEAEAAEAEEAEAEAKEPEERVLKASTEANRRKKAERREAKAARKEANRIEEKKSRPNNIVLAILIFGVLIGMFAFVRGYNYFSKPASIEKYLEEMGMAEMYTDIPYSMYTTLTMRAEGNTVKIWLDVSEDAPEDELELYTGEEGTEELERLAAYFLTEMKPATQGLSATGKVKVSQGDETINYVKISYSDAKKITKEAEEEAAEAAEEAEGDAEEAEDAED